MKTSTIVAVLVVLLVVLGGWYVLGLPMALPLEQAGPSGSAGTNGSSNQGNLGGEDTGTVQQPGGFAAYNSGIRGTVMAGPTCPVERDPPDPQCADKPLATLVAVFRKSDLVHAVALLQSDKNGAFEVSLSPGEYVVGAGESSMPHCAQTPATVAPNAYTAIVVECDTGIR